MYTPFAQPFSKWPKTAPFTQSLPMGDFREIQFGPYVFPLTMQERNRDQKLALLKKKIPFTPGDYNPANVSFVGASTEIYGPVGVNILSGILDAKLGYNKLILTPDDVESERAYLAGLQAQGALPLWVRPDRFVFAKLEDFNHSFTDGTSWKMADWVCKFYMQDPRYYGTVAQVFSVKESSDPGGGGSQYSKTVAQNGTTKSFPTFTFKGRFNGPAVMIDYGNGAHIKLCFSQLNSGSDDKLTIYCDPRPESQQVPAVWIHNGVAQNAMSQVQPSDFSNTMDYQYFLPYIDTSKYGQGTQTVKFGTTGGGSYTFSAAYYDTYI